jgi:hypothetical protein
MGQLIIFRGKKEVATQLDKVPEICKNVLKSCICGRLNYLLVIFCLFDTWQKAWKKIRANFQNSLE